MERKWQGSWRCLPWCTCGLTLQLGDALVIARRFIFDVPAGHVYQRLHNMIFTVRSGDPPNPQTPKLWNFNPKQVTSIFWSSKGFSVIFTVSGPTRQSPCLLLVSPSFGETKLPSNSASWRAFCALPAPGPSGTGNRCQGSVGWGLDWSFWLTSSRANMRLGNFFVFFKIDFIFKFGCQMSDDFVVRVFDCVMPSQAPPGQLEEAFTGDSKKYLPFGLLQGMSLLGGCLSAFTGVVLLCTGFRTELPKMAQNYSTWFPCFECQEGGSPPSLAPNHRLDPPTIKWCHSFVAGIWGRKISSLTSVIFKIIDCISSSYRDKLYILVVSLPRCSLLKSKEIVQNRLAGLTNGPFCSWCRGSSGKMGCTSLVPAGPPGFGCFFNAWWGWCYVVLVDYLLISLVNLMGLVARWAWNWVSVFRITNHRCSYQPTAIS